MQHMQKRVDEFIDESDKTPNKLQVIYKCIRHRNYLSSHHKMQKMQIG